LEGRELHTLKRHSPFLITTVDENGVEGHPVKTGKRLLIRRNFLEPMWQDLQNGGRLDITAWKATATLPGIGWATTYAAAILAELEEVDVETADRNLVLVLKQK
jgi:hypothetical protein